MGRIADILRARSDLDEALRILREDLLPVFERLGDVRERATTLQRIASSLIESGGLEQGKAQDIHDALAEAYGIVQRLKEPFGIGPIGAQYAQILAMGGHRDKALEVLSAAREAFQKTQNAAGVARVDELTEQIGKSE